MAKRVALEINGHDYSKYIESGIKWERNDVDSNKAVRVKENARMRRDKLGVKRKLSFDFLRMPFDVGVQLAQDVSTPEYTATHSDMEYGIKTGTYYTTTIKGELVFIDEDGEGVWEGVSFDMIEI